MARRGAGRLEDDRDAKGADLASRERQAHPPADRQGGARWIDEGPVRDEAESAVRRGRSPSRSATPSAPVDVEGAGLARGATAAQQARQEQRLRDAARAFERERFGDARRILKPLVDQAPGSVSVRELYGLSLYRLGRWRDAAAELEVVRDLSRSTDQHPVLADCYRALGRHHEVDELWEELRAASPSADLVTEGRIVVAGSLADRDRLRDAVALLEAGFKLPKRPLLHHVRRAYALADLYERAGELPRARGLFERIRAIDPEFADIDERIHALR